MKILYHKYLNHEALEGFDRYKYSCKDTSPLSNYVMHPFWNKAVLLCPRWIAPNLLTLVGFICCILHYLLPAIYDYDFTASTDGSDYPIPSWVWLTVAIMLFASHTLDGIDGKQARRTGTSSPLGELFDHGCDSWAAVFITSTFYNTFGRNQDGYSISIKEMYFIHINVFLSFYLSHWEKYNTGIMYLPWAYDFSMVGGTILYTLTSILGYQTWKFLLPGGVSPGLLLQIMLYFGTFGLSVPVALRNIYLSYRDATGKMRTLSEAIRPLISFFLGMGLSTLWACWSPNDILAKDTRMFYYMVGTLSANLSCRLIVSQMSNTRCELINVLVLPLAVGSGSCLLVPGLPVEAEMTVLYLLSLLFTLFHLHYGICVVIQMCDHLKIEAFRIKASNHHKSDDQDQVRLISSPSSSQDFATALTAASDSENEVNDAHDLEVLVH